MHNNDVTMKSSNVLIIDTLSLHPPFFGDINFNINYIKLKNNSGLFKL